MREAGVVEVPLAAQPAGEAEHGAEDDRAAAQDAPGALYVPNNSVLVISGTWRRAHAFARRGGCSARGSRRGSHPPLAGAEAAPIPKSRVIAMEHPQVRTATLMFEWHGRPRAARARSSPTRRPAGVRHLRAPPGSRRLVDSGACVGAGFAWQTAANVGPIMLSATATPEKADDCVRRWWRAAEDGGAGLTSPRGDEERRLLPGGRRINERETPAATPTCSPSGGRRPGSTTTSTTWRT